MKHRKTRATMANQSRSRCRFTRRQRSLVDMVKFRVLSEIVRRFIENNCEKWALSKGFLVDRVAAPTGSGLLVHQNGKQILTDGDESAMTFLKNSDINVHGDEP